MQKIYFLKNNYTIFNREYNFTTDIPILIHEKIKINKKIKSIYLNEKKGQTSALVLSLDTDSMLLTELKVTNYINSFTYYYNFDIDQYSRYSSAIAIGISKMYLENEALHLLLKFQIHIFKNLIIILLEHDSCPEYYINEHDLFGVITDKDFNIIGFVINKIPSITISHLKHDFEHRNLLKESHFSLYDCKTKIMNNNNFLIKKIIELENIDQWQVLYYGLKRNLIDSKFILNYCYALLEQGKSSDQFVLDIAALTGNDVDKIPDRVAVKINDHDKIMIDCGQYYNKVWFYLSLAAQMCEEKIIK